MSDPNTPDPVPPGGPAVTPIRPSRTPRRLGWLAAAGLLAVAVGVGAKVWLERTSDADAAQYVPGPVSADPVWAKRKQEVEQLVEAVRKDPPKFDEQSPTPVTDVPSNTPPDLSAVKIATDHRTFDLRGWRPTGSGDGPHAVGVTMARHLRLTKGKPVDRLDFLGRTSGSDIVMRCEEPSPAKAQVFASGAKPTVEGKAMTERRLSVDVADVPVGKEFALGTKTTFWNSLQTPEEQWLGAIGSDGSQMLSLLVLFPEGRPFKGGGLRTGPTDGDLEPYTGTMLVFKGADGSWVYWEVPGPQVGHTYRLDWKW